MIYSPPREHGPPHVHVRRGEAQVRIALSPVRLLRDSGMREAEVRAAVRLVERYEHDLIARWREIHGDSTTD